MQRLSLGWLVYVIQAAVADFLGSLHKKRKNANWTESSPKAVNRQNRRSLGDMPTLRMRVDVLALRQKSLYFMRKARGCSWYFRHFSQ
jgi:hypothetical protein